MNGSVPSRRLSVFPLIAALSAIGVTCSIFSPQVFPWMGVGWLAWVLSAALWVKASDRRNRRGYCDPSRLLPSEAASIPPEAR